jgi:hypothetical protein
MAYGRFCCSDGTRACFVQVATWLDAVLYVSDFRPVALREHVKDGMRILDHNNQVGIGCISMHPLWAQ